MECPGCQDPSGISAVSNRRGAYCFPCLSCGQVAIVAPDGGFAFSTAEPCRTPGCDGSTGLGYRYLDSGVFDRAALEPCDQCYGGDRTQQWPTRVGRLG
ncbi:MULTISPECIES: hypothetical protein [Streptomyces]|uniref:Uncharacterized protein n=2 Tax=Streptomyces TaxID=1883 RepID=A0A1I6RI20_9ACTN|nr:MULTISPECIES: hypothetical protein [Streptomyces]MCK1815555.1 hypothetical protein [Streptomyces sp. XM4011]QKV68679.1 hypothetical protein HUT13_07685 [Streptomyces harbinensis]SFS64342.1 hypothetical protein SAMN05444716_10394 [Streptomyces harbinensis]